MATNTASHRVGAMEILAVIGFSLLLGWVFPNYFWFFNAADAFMEEATRVYSLSALYVGFVLGALLLREIVQRLTRSRAFPVVQVASTAFTIILACLVAVGNFGVALPQQLFVASSLLAGMASASLIVSWLDICGKTRIRHFLVFTSASFAGGAALFFLCWALPPLAQPLISVVFVVLSMLVLLYLNQRSKQPEVVEVLRRSEYLTFSREVEPSFFALGLIFGIAFVLLYDLGQTAILVAVLAILIGALVMTGMAVSQLNFSIVHLLRVLTVALVGILLLLTVAPVYMRIPLLAVVASLWAVFTAANYANLVTLVVRKNLAISFHISSGLLPKAAGFTVGFILVSLLLGMGLREDAVTWLLLAAAFMLVLAAMVFYPQQRHHGDEAAPASDFVAHLPHESADDNIQKVKCEAVANLFRLSSREAEILQYLVKGRNAEYICNKLTISSHTVKSHIYSIYRKTNIHSQQKLMDLVEDFPVEYSPLP